MTSSDYGRRDDQIQPRHFDRVARACEFPAAELRQIIVEMAAALPGNAATIQAEMEAGGIRHLVIRKLVVALATRANRILKAFEAA